MNRILKKYFTKCFTHLLDFDLINDAAQKATHHRNIEQITSGNNCQFYTGSSVQNFQNDRTKIKIGSNVHIRGELLVWPYGQGITIGDNSFIGENSKIWSGERVSIGSNVLIAHSVSIIDSDSHEKDFEERALGFVNLTLNGHSTQKGNVRTAPIVIEDYAWISYNVCILKGVHVGKGAIIGAGSVVKDDVPPFSIVSGNPAIEHIISN